MGALRLADLNRMGREAFTGALAGVFEASPWVAERAWTARPFATVEALHAAMAAVVRRAAPAEQEALLRAHPDLAGRAAGAMSEDSVAEQASAGLDRLTDGEHARFERLNRAYRERFGLPFIIAVRRHDRAGILAAFDRRLTHTRAQEVAEALAQVADIARFRLEALVEAP